MAENKTNESTEMTVNGGFSELSNMNFLAEAMNDECAGLEFSLDRVKIPAGGMTAFEVPTGDGESSELQKEIECVILLSHPANAYYRDVYKGGSNPPDCGSFDGVTGSTGALCKTCPYNQFGSGEGKANEKLPGTPASALIPMSSSPVMRLKSITTPGLSSPIRIGNSSRCIRTRASAEPIPATGKDSMR